MRACHSAWVASLALVLAAGCGKNDLGEPCQLSFPTTDGGVVPFEIPEGSTTDYIATGLSECDDFTCIDTAGRDPRGGYCSKRCIDNASCKSGDRKKSLACTELVLDQEFIETLRASLGEEEFRALFGDIQTARYCALTASEP